MSGWKPKRQIPPNYEIKKVKNMAATEAREAVGEYKKLAGMTLRMQQFVLISDFQSRSSETSLLSK